MDLLICYIGSLTGAHDKNYHRKPNLAHCHLMAYLLNIKYSFTFLIALEHFLTPMANKIFHLFYVTKRHSPQDDEGAEEEEYPTHETLF